MAKRFRRNIWYQVGGDVNPAGHGGTLAREDDLGRIEVWEIQVVTDYIGWHEAKEVGYPFWCKEACYDMADFRDFLADEFACRSMDIDREPALRDLSKRANRFYLATEMLCYGFRCDERAGGFSGDVLPKARVSWWSKGGIKGFRAVDVEFRAMMRGES